VSVEKVASAKDLNHQDVSNKVQRDYILHKSSGDLYLDESMNLVRCKCACIAFVSLPYITLRTAFHISRLIVDTACIAKHFFSEKGKNQQGHTNLAHRHIMQAFVCAKKNMTFIVKAPLYAIGVQFVSLLGLIHPFLARRWIAKIENFYHDGSNIKDISCCIDTLLEPHESFCKSIYQHITEKKDVLFLANCFQPRGNISSKHIKLLS
jgi:hypothetical protein